MSDERMSPEERAWDAAGKLLERDGIADAIWTQHSLATAFEGAIRSAEEAAADEALERAHVMWARGEGHKIRSLKSRVPGSAKR